MKRSSTVLALGIVFILLPMISLPAQTMNPPYLSQMPTAERIKAEVKGADAMDTAARRMGAFWQLRELIYDLAWRLRRVYRTRLTPDETRLLDSYYAGYAAAAKPYEHIQNSPSHPDKPKWYQMHAFYETDPGFLDELLTRFCSADFRAAVYRVTGKRPPSPGQSALPGGADNPSPSPQAPPPGAGPGAGRQQAVTATLSVTSGLTDPSGTLIPLGGSLLALFKESFEGHLRKKGTFQVPPGSPAPASPLAAWASLCQAGSPACTQALNEMRPQSVAEAQADAHGRATVTGVAPGTYFLFSVARYNNQWLVWDVKVDLKPGVNAILLDQRNRAPRATDLARTNPGEATQPTSGAGNRPQPSAPAAPSAQAYLAEGNKHYEAKDYAKAVVAYKRAIAATPSSAAHNQLGNAYSKLKQHAEAVAAYQQAIRLKPDNLAAHHGLGLAYNDLKQHDKAIGAFREVLRIKPDYADAYFFLGGIHYTIRQYPEAQTALEQALRLKLPDVYVPIAYSLLGMAYAATGKKQEALQVYKTLLAINKERAQELYDEINKPSGVAHREELVRTFAAGSKYYKEGDYAKAIEAFKKLIALQPDAGALAAAHKTIGMSYNNLERYQEAVRPLQESLRLDANQHIVSKELGFAYFMLNQYPDAISAFQQSVRAKPDYAEAHYLLGYTYVRMGKKEEALQVYRRLLTVDKQEAQELYAKINQMK